MPEPTGRSQRLLAQAGRFDLWLLVPVLLLSGLGLVMVFSTSSILAERRYGDAYYFLKRQGLSLAVGLLAMAGVKFVPTRFYRVLAYPLLVLALVFLVLVLVPGVGVTAGGATAWIHLWNLSFQPSELAKLALVVYLAFSLARKDGRMEHFSIGVLPHLIVSGLVMALILLQNDFGMFGVLGLTLMAMLFLGGARIKHLLALLATGAAVSVGLILVAPYRVERIVTFLDPWSDPMGAGFQIIHSFLAFGTGGLLGAGVGQSTQKLGYLPEPHTDFVFAILAEETGFLGVILTLGLFLVLALRGLRYARLAQDPFRRFLGAGLTLMIALQALVNMAVVLGLLPITGLTLPFISYGGSSLLTNFVATGMLMSLAVEVKKSDL